MNMGPLDKEKDKKHKAKWLHITNLIQMHNCIESFTLQKLDQIPKLYKSKRRENERKLDEEKYRLQKRKKEQTTCSSLILFQRGNGVETTQTIFSRKSQLRIR